MLREYVLDLHAEHRADACEAEHHQPNQRPIAQANDRRDLDAVDEVRASSGAKTGVLPDFTTCDGPRTEPAGFTGTTRPVTSQSNSWRIAASRALTVGAALSYCCSSIQAATWTGCAAATDGTP
jgi:hypothetical protein